MNRPTPSSARPTPLAGQAASTTDSGRGRLIRDGVDRALTVDPCRPRFPYRGTDPAASGDRARLLWRLALVPRTGAAC
ncbi:hypothetical protein [Streptomyces phaeoluteigriseus]|uniref:hypothetical protein n=1 Tax=Streptomyces phaeoluteigriseus TaxID=114686 RepID=UPI0036CE907A